MTGTVRYRWTVGVVLVVLVGFVQGNQRSFGQLVAELYSNKSIYEYGEPISITFKLSNPTTEVIEFQESCDPIIVFAGFEFSSICLAAEIWYYFSPSSWRTWTFEMKPNEYGLPTQSGLNLITWAFHIYSESVSVSAPRYVGGWIDIEFVSGTSPDEINNIRQSLNGIVIGSRVRFNGNLSETWEIVGTSIEDAIANYQGHNAIVKINHTHPGLRIFTVDVVDPISLPGSFDLYQNYPNPFNPMTTIRYTLPRPGDARIEVFDLLGKRVLVLENGFKPSGEFETTFDATGLSSGVYFYTLATRDFSQTRKMVVVR